MNLFKVELRRIFARRLTWVLAAVALGGIVIGGLTTFAHAGRVVQSGFFNGTQEVFTSRKAGFDLTNLHEIWAGSTAGFSFFAVLLGASLIGADWRSGTVGLQLTWEPRRARLALTKAGALMSVAVVAYLVYAVVLALALLPAALVHGSTAGMDAAWWREGIGILLRGAAASAVVIAIGFSIALVGRNAAAALGVLFVYTSILENILSARFPWMTRWLLVRNIARFVEGNDIGDLAQRSTIAAGITLAMYAAAVVGAAVWIFRARDVT